jgi:hypothetical protein
VRGVDFKLSGLVYVLMPFTSKRYFEIVQALRRGSRDFSNSFESTTVFP